MSKLSEGQMLLSPRVPPLVPALSFAFPSLRDGIAEDSAGSIGITFFHCPEHAYAAVDVRGGSPGTTFTDALRAGYGESVSGISRFALVPHVDGRPAVQSPLLCLARVSHLTNGVKSRSCARQLCSTTKGATMMCIPTMPWV